MQKKNWLRNKSLLEKIDIFGTATSLLCIIHCGVIPVLLMFGTIGISVAGTNHKLFDLTLIALGLFFGFVAFYSGYKFHHSKILPFVLFFIGFLFFITGYFGYIETANEFCISTGSFFLIVAHFFNWKYCKNCKRCNTQIADEV